MSDKAKAAIYGVVALLIGGTLGFFTAGLMVIGSLGGQHTPPVWWGIVVLFGIFGLSPFLAFGWIPTAMRMARGAPWKKWALITHGAGLGLFILTFILWEIGRPKV
jgi:hypothetical protein